MNTHPCPSTDQTLSPELLDHLLQQHRRRSRLVFERLWDYYRNELNFEAPDARRLYRTAQEAGLAPRLTGRPRPLPGGAARTGPVGGGRREIVVENDIAWRLHTMVDFMFGRPVGVESCAAGEKKHLIENILALVIERNGGLGFLQDMALLGGVYGHVDLLMRVDRLGGGDEPGIWESLAGQAASTPEGERARLAIELAGCIELETVEAPRAIPLLNSRDYRRVEAYILDYERVEHRLHKSGWLARLLKRSDAPAADPQARTRITEIWTAHAIQTHEDGRLVRTRPNPLGRLPLVHIQNLPLPLSYGGLGEVEPLIPLQDELNTRLSDRANRITMQSFKMYLGKGIEGFADRPVGPGQMWITENMDASIQEFGGDQANVSEDIHIREIRDAMDKTSGVSALAAGLLRGRVGNLTSENALRLVMMGLLAKTEKKRMTYGRGLEQLCRMVLELLDVSGLLPTSERERAVKLHWPSALPENQGQKLAEAEAKLRIGIPQRQVLAELGYQDCARSA